MGLLSSLVFAAPLQMLTEEHENNVLLPASGLRFAVKCLRVPLCRTRANDEVSVLSSGLKNICIVWSSVAQMRINPVFFLM